MSRKSNWFYVRVGFPKGSQLQKIILFVKNTCPSEKVWYKSTDVSYEIWDM
jgi:hypothetical protein